MSDIQNHIEKILSATSRTETHGQRGRFRPIAKILNKISGKSWSWQYARNVFTGGDEIRPTMKKAIEIAARRIDRREAERSDYRLRPVQCLCALAEYDDILKNSTRGRAEKLLGE